MSYTTVSGVLEKFMTKPTMKILIVDDDADIRQAVRLTLEEQDYLNVVVTESIDVASGIEQMKAIKPDIVILDLHMPDKTGFDFMDIVHQDKRLAKTKVIMLTADDNLANIFKAEDKGIGAYHFLGKPFNISELQALVLSLSLPIPA